jgi:hypothetical protein
MPWNRVIVDAMLTDIVALPEDAGSNAGSATVGAD